jgi:general secretion pathway protein J
MTPRTEHNAGAPRPRSGGAGSLRIRGAGRARLGGGRSPNKRGMTLLEILVSLGIMAMISLLIYGAFDSLSRGRRGEALRADRARQGRDAVERISRELQSAFMSMHTPQMQVLITRTTGFVGQNSSRFDRVDFTSFSHRRIGKEAKESDQAAVGFFVVKDPDVDGKMDLVRREQAPIEFDFKRGGVVNILAEDVEQFDLKYLDPLTGQWVETWDSTLMTAQLGRLPLEIRIDLELKPVKNTPPFRYVTKIMMPIQQPLKFGIMQ